MERVPYRKWCKMQKRDKKVLENIKAQQQALKNEMRFLENVNHQNANKYIRFPNPGYDMRKQFENYLDGKIVRANARDRRRELIKNEAPEIFENIVNHERYAS